MARVTALRILNETIEARCNDTIAAHPYWPCRRGCDHCCRSLAQLPTLTPPEWALLRDAIDALPPEVQADVRARATVAPETGPVVCPMLDLQRGECRVYAARPIACRTYGFYADRDAGMHCDDVTAAVRENGAEATVIWGNGGAIENALKAHGDGRSLRAWLSGEREAPSGGQLR